MNGIGGHIELGETPQQAMCREFDEETGLCTLPSWWEQYVCIQNPEAMYELNVFRCVLGAPSGRPALLNADDAEPVAWFAVNHIPRYHVIPNLKWLIPLALDKTIQFPFVLQDTGR